MGNYAAKGNGLNPNPMPLSTTGGNMYSPIDIGGSGNRPDVPQRKRNKRVPEMSPVDVSSPDLVAPPSDIPPAPIQPRMRFGASLGEPTAFLGGSSGFNERGLGGPGSDVPFAPPMNQPQIPMNPRAMQSGWSRMVRPTMPLQSLAMNLGRR